jgi:2-oxoacid:acceptor oxidoreductase delta subunit (pyruvate/2-ketoisovalerate family)
MEYQKIKIPKDKLLPEGGIVKAPAPNTEQPDMITGGWRVLRPIIDEEKCTHCRLCWIDCPDACINLGEDAITVNLKYCKGCGICGEICPVGAIEMVPELDFEDGVVYQEGLF